MTVRILEGDCLEVLRTLGDETVHCVVTSPPFWGLRDYGVPPSVWGGDPDCNHVWSDEVIDRSRATPGVEGSGLTNDGASQATAARFEMRGTYTLKSEPGTSLRAAGWTLIAEVKGRQWDCPSRPRDKRPAEDKLLWEFAA